LLITACGFKEIGNSLGFRVPEAIVNNFDIKIGAKIEVDFKQSGDVILRKKSKAREGWATAFASYALEGEDELMLPDFLDVETDTYFGIVNLI
jgi:antitoxin component of MazEF toxin-antitoxin module